MSNSFLIGEIIEFMAMIEREDFLSVWISKNT